MTYDELKNYFQEHKKELMLGVGFVVVFIVGFGAGRFDKYSTRQHSKQQANYTTNKAAAPVKATGEVKGEVTEKATQSASTTPAKAGECKIKGNISSSKKKIYHMPGGAFYERTQPEQCFNTEAEAQAAGFVRSSR